MRVFHRLVILSVAAFALGACQMGGRQAELSPVEQVVPRGIEGRWNAIGGAVAYNANFNGGRYSANETGNGAVLAEGTYIVLGPGQVSIKYKSKVRKQEFAVNCNQVEPNRLSCAASDGNRYDFTRI